MSSNESSGASAEATATSPAPIAESSFGSTRGSGLARGKGKRPSAAVASTTASTPYTPTAIEVVTAPREYQNPFAPVETPAAVTSEPAPAAAPAPAAYVPPVTPVKPEPAAVPAPAPAAASEPEVQAELNILPPEQPKSAPAQTWESEGFRPARETRNDRPRREESAPRREEAPRRNEPRNDAPFDPSTIPAKFLYVRPGYNYVPTPSNYGGAPRERDNRPASASTAPQSAPASAASAEAPKSGGGFFGWLKSLFGGAPAASAPTEIRTSEQRQGDRPQGGNRQRNYEGGEGGQRRRSRGGRGRGQRSGEYRSGGDRNAGSSGPQAT